MAHRRDSIAIANTGITAGVANTTVASRNTSLPTAPRDGQIFVLDGSGTGDTIYVYVEFDDGTKDWFEIGFAGA